MPVAASGCRQLPEALELPLDDLRKHGYAVIPCGNLATAQQAVARLGRVVLETDVRLRPGARTYLASPEAIPFHNDHPAVTLIAWLCVSQDAHDGASELVDLAQEFAALPAHTRRLLSSVELKCPALDSTVPDSRYPLYSRSSGQLFWAPWLLPDDVEAETRAALDMLAKRIDSPESKFAIRLQPSELLVVDNRRMLHGRGRLKMGSNRFLKRFWIAI